MSEHRTAIDAIEQADSHTEIRNIVRGYSASALDPHAHTLFYGGQILEAPPESERGIYGDQVAAAIARLTGANMLDHTPRGELLLDKEVEKAIKDRSIALDMRAGMTRDQAEKRVEDFLYGPKTSPANDRSALRNSLWGEASHEYAVSPKGGATFVGVSAPHERIGAQVELPAALAESKVTAIGGHSADTLRQLQAARGNVAVVEKVQERFREAVRLGGIHVSADGSEVQVSRETANHLALPNAGAFSPAAELEARGLRRGVVVGSTELAQAARDASHVVRFAGPAVAGLGVVGVAGSVLEAREAFLQAQQLASEHNANGAVHVVRHYAATTIGGVVGGAAGGAATGALWGAAGGAETGPGATVTGLIGLVGGGIVGTAGALGINHAIERYGEDHRTGTDGVGYTYNDGRWTHRPWFGEPTAAPLAQVARLDYGRATQITERNLADAPTPQDKLDTARVYATEYHQQGWDKAGAMPESVASVLAARHDNSDRQGRGAAQGTAPQNPAATQPEAAAGRPGSGVAPIGTPPPPPARKPGEREPATTELDDLHAAIVGRDRNRLAANAKAYLETQEGQAWRQGGAAAHAQAGAETHQAAAASPRSMRLGA